LPFTYYCALINILTKLFECINYKIMYISEINWFSILQAHEQILLINKKKLKDPWSIQSSSLISLQNLFNNKLPSQINESPNNSKMRFGYDANKGQQLGDGYIFLFYLNLIKHYCPISALVIFNSRWYAFDASIKLAYVV
jgi:hypothetical protein